MPQLWPPLTVIENELFSPSDALIRRWWADKSLPANLRRALEADPDAQTRRSALEQAKQESATVVADESVYPLLPDLQALIRRRVAARQAEFSPIPTPGQIVRIDEARGPRGPLDWDLPRPLAVLLSESTETPQVWYGWLVASESDYASCWDLLLGLEDEPCDPLARMVQLWNPVHVYLPSVSRVLAELSPERLAAVRALALDCATAPEPDPTLARPGVSQRRQVGGYWVRTGTPLGSPNDLRHRYQQLYHAYAAAVREPAALTAAQSAGASAPTVVSRLLERLRDSLAAAFGAALQPYQPLVQPMGGIGGPDSLHYEAPGWVRFTLAETDDGNALLRLETLCATPLRVQLLADDELVKTARLDPDRLVVELRLDPAQPRLLRLLDDQGKERYRIPLFADGD